MCLHISNKARIKTARKDIYCLKKMELGYHGNYYSTVQYFRYPKTGYHKVKEIIINDKGYDETRTVNIGIHSWVITRKNIRTAINDNDWYTENYSNQCMVLCIIPKGAKYIEGLCSSYEKSYVSDQIQIIGKI